MVLVFNMQNIQRTWWSFKILTTTKKVILVKLGD
jgi:hypothetical protein